MLIALVDVTSSCVGLPDFDQAVTHWSTVAARYAAADDDPLPQRATLVLAREIVVQRPYLPVAVSGPGDLREGLGQDDERLLRRPQARRLVVGIQVRGMDLGVRVAPEVGGFAARLLCHARCYSSFPHPRLPNRHNFTASPQIIITHPTFSTTMAIPCPTPTHMVASPNSTSGRRPISCTSVARMRAPEHPMGCPRAIAPPLGFNRSSAGSIPHSWT